MMNPKVADRIYDIHHNSYNSTKIKKINKLHLMHSVARFPIIEILFELSYMLKISVFALCKEVSTGCIFNILW